MADFVISKHLAEALFAEGMHETGNALDLVFRAIGQGSEKIKTFDFMTYWSKTLEIAQNLLDYQITRDAPDNIVIPPDVTPFVFRMQAWQLADLFRLVFKAILKDNFKVILSEFDSYDDFTLNIANQIIDYNHD